MSIISIYHLYSYLLSFFFFTATATTDIYTLSLHDALPISLTRNDDAGEIQRISRRDGNDFTGRLLVAHGAQRLDGHRQSKLLSQKAADESATSNLSAIFQAPQGYKQLTPLGDRKSVV